jgi:hypothetical protein
LKSRGAFAGILLTLFLARSASLVLLFILPTPAGTWVAAHPFDILPAALVGRIGTLAFLAALAALLSWASPRLGLALFAAGGIFLQIFSQLDLEIVRWTGEHLNRESVVAYDLAAHGRLLKEVVFGDTLAFVTSVLLVTLPAVIIFVVVRRREPERVTRRATVFLAGLWGATYLSFGVLAPTASARRWARPVLLGIVEESLATLGDTPSPRD